MKVVLYSCVVAALVLAGAPVRALEPFVLYDNFNAALINPAKWIGFEFFGGGAEANRRIDPFLGELRMSYRAYGNTASNNGFVLSTLGLAPIKNFNAITALSADVAVLKAQFASCPGNSFASSGNAGLIGSFFNTGTPTPGSETNDVLAVLFLTQLSTGPRNILNVRAVVFRCADQFCSQFNSVQQRILGTANVGAAVQLQMQWDPPNDRFLFQRGTDPIVAISYAPLADTAPPGIRFKDLRISHFVANCTTNPRPNGFWDVAFDNVRVNQSANP